MADIKISLFKPSSNGRPGLKPHSTDFYTEMAKIADGSHYTVIKKLRELQGDDERRDYKAAKLQALTISAVVDTKREIKNCKPSGLLAIDLDPKGNPTVEDWGQVRDMLFEMPEVLASFVSASGNGCAFIVKIDPKQFKDTFYSIADELSDNFDLNIDLSCSDISRLRFISHDPDIKLRRNYDDVPLKQPSTVYMEAKANKERKPIEYTGEVGSADCDRAMTYAIKSAEQKAGVFGDGNKHSFLVSLAGFCNTVGMTKEYLEAEVVKRYGGLTDISTERLLKPIDNVYKAYKHKHNTFVQTVAARRLSNKITGELVNNVIHKGIKPTPEILGEIAERLEANIDRVEAIAERVVSEYKEEFNQEAKIESKSFKQFWYMDDDDKVCISKLAFRDFLIQHGIFRYRVDKKWILVRIIDNIVEEIQKADLKQVVFNFVEKARELEVWEVLANRVSSVFADDYLEILPERIIHFHRDTADDISLLYKNGVVEVRKDIIKFVEWKDFRGYVWKKQILDRDITLVTERKKSDFEVFLRNITKNNTDRFFSVCSAIGYLLHLYKNKGNLPAIILNDEAISDEPAGGTGKGLIMDAVSRYRNVEIIDGKLFDFNERFRYQNVTLETQIVYFDDINKNFPFERLFSSITTTFEAETKGGLKIKFPFSISPKIAISTNYAIPGVSGSFVRRKHELEITQYYTPDFTPAMEFDKQLFDDFTPEEWIDCDNFIFEACALYLSDGLKKQVLINQPLKQLHASTDKDFVDFMDEEYSIDFSHPYKIDQLDAYEKYMRLYPSKLGSKTFYKFMERYFTYHKIKYVRNKSGDKRLFYIGTGGIF